MPFPESTEGQTPHDPIAEQKARTIEAILDMLPRVKQYTNPNPDFCALCLGHNECRSEIISLLPQIIAEIEKRKVEDIVRMIDERIEQGNLLAKAYEKGDDLESGDDPAQLMNDELAIIAGLESLKEEISKLS